MNKQNVTVLHIKDRTFYIIYDVDNSLYLAIDSKYIDSKGCLTTKLNGLQMKASKKLEECIESVKMSVEIDYLMSKGMTLKKAMKTYLQTI